VGADFHDIALVGFAPSERATFETFFRLVSSRRPKPFRAVADVATADVVFVDAGKDYRLIEVADRLTERQILVTFGSVRASNSTRHLDRPINLNAVLLTLDASVSAAPVGGAAPVNVPSAAPVRSVPTAPLAAATNVAAPKYSPTLVPASVPPAIAQQPRAEFTTIPVLTPARATPKAPVEQPIAPKVMPVAAVSRPAPVAPQPAAAKVSAAQAPPSVATVTTLSAARAANVQPALPEPSDATGGVRILVVDDSDVALKFIHNRLSAFGFTVDKCMSGEEALVRVSDGDYAFVFLDVMMAGLDGYQTCKAIKGRRYPGGKAPIVVMLTSRGGTIDKVRGTFAGCDAYLTKPLDEVKMLKVLLKHDPHLADSISTLAAPNPTLPRAVSAPGVNPLAASFESLTDRARQ
jgi:CheY-like chemotaxis protein